MKPRFDQGYWLVLEVVVGLAMAFLLLPLIFVALNSIGPAGLAYFPPPEFSILSYTTIPVKWLWSTLAAIGLGLTSTAGGAVLGTLAALALVRGGLRARGLVESLCRSPLQIPSLVLGVAFLQFYSWAAMSGGPDLRGSYLGLAIAHTAVATPFVMVVVLARLKKFDWNLEEAAQGLGASPMQTFIMVTLPIIAPAVLSGCFFAFLLSIDNVPLSLFLVGAGQPLLPVDLFNSIQFDLTRTVYAVSTIVSAITTIVVATAFRRLTSVFAASG
jgi:ABC-type spermidine/putrescine transport system permease subunit II